MKKAILVFLVSIFLSCEQGPPRPPRIDSKSLVVIKDFNSTAKGYGQNVVAEVENKSNRTVSIVVVEFTWRDKEGRLITSQKGTVKNISPNSTGVADSYFDEMPAGATYAARIDQVRF